MVHNKQNQQVPWLLLGLCFHALLVSEGFGTAADSHLPSLSSNCPALILQVAKLVERPWVDRRFSTLFLEQLAPVTDDRLQADFNLEADPIRAAAAGFRHHRPGFTPLDIDHYIAQRIHPSGPRLPVVLFVMHLRNQPVGFLALSLKWNKGVLEAWSEYLKVDTSIAETQGISRSFFDFTRVFYQKLGVKTERLEAGWAGRPIWARKGYRFDPDVTLLEDGKPRPQLDVIRRNFQRFLQFHKIRLEDLFLGGDLGGREAIDASLSNLNTPEDFLNVQHTSGVRIEVAPYIDADTLGTPSLEAVGKAFTLWDYRPRSNQTISISQDGKQLSDIAMPTWIGIYRFDRPSR